MSSQNCKEQEQGHIPSNDQIIDEITEDFKQQQIGEEVLVSSPTPAEENASSCSNPQPDVPTTPTDGIPEDFYKSDSDDEEAGKPNIPDDFIDEDKLKELNATLTQEQKDERNKQAGELKKQGNAEYKDGKYLESIESYTEALRLCPWENQSDRSILYANRGASKLQLKYKQPALDDCSKAIELNPNYVRAYLRRAKLYEETDKLDESLEDYKKVLELDPGNAEATKAAVRLPPMINERNEKLKTEMFGKLKDLGNMFLKPFGLSTENFQLQQDPNSGGYSVNFKQNSE